MSKVFKILPTALAVLLSGLLFWQNLQLQDTEERIMDLTLRIDSVGVDNQLLKNWGIVQRAELELVADELTQLVHSSLPCNDFRDSLYNIRYNLHIFPGDSLMPE